MPDADEATLRRPGSRPGGGAVGHGSAGPGWLGTGAALAVAGLLFALTARVAHRERLAHQHGSVHDHKVLGDPLAVGDQQHTQPVAHQGVEQGP